jgi:hypothetical protein
MTSEREELGRRALEWMKANDGGNLCVWWPCGSKPGDGSRPIMAVSWDNGGVGELGTFYHPEDAKAMETIVDIFNWALGELAPSEVGWGGQRTYKADEVTE